MSATPVMWLKCLALLYLSSNTQVVCVAVAAPPLELQENIIPGTETNIATTKETEASINVAEEKESNKPISDIGLESEPAVPFIQTTTPTSSKPATLPVPLPAPA